MSWRRNYKRRNGLPVETTIENKKLNKDGENRFVVDGETGVICRSEEEWKKALIKFSSKEPNIQESKIRDYYQTHMDWNGNIRELFSRL